MSLKCLKQLFLPDGGCSAGDELQKSQTVHFLLHSTHVAKICKHSSTSYCLVLVMQLHVFRRNSYILICGDFNASLTFERLSKCSHTLMCCSSKTFHTIKSPTPWGSYNLLSRTSLRRGPVVLTIRLGTWQIETTSVCT